MGFEITDSERTNEDALTARFDMENNWTEVFRGLVSEFDVGFQGPRVIRPDEFPRDQAAMNALANHLRSKFDAEELEEQVNLAFGIVSSNVTRWNVSGAMAQLGISLADKTGSKAAEGFEDTPVIVEEHRPMLLLAIGEAKAREGNADAAWSALIKAQMIRSFGEHEIGRVNSLVLAIAEHELSGSTG